MTTASTHKDVLGSSNSTEESFATFARLGYAARGVVYLIVGGLAVLAAFGQGGQTTDSKGALITLLQQPFGEALLIGMIVGLFGYAAWRLVQSIKDTDHHGRSARGLSVRIGLFISAITHAALAIWAISLLTGSEDGDSQGWTQQLLAMDNGEWILGFAGLAIIAAGLAHIYKGFTARFDRYIDFPAEHSGWMRAISRFGLLARGVVWCIIGWFVMDSAHQAYNNEVQGMGQALAALRDTGYGPWLMGVVAAGLFAFGLYSLIEARYRRVNPDFSDG